MCKQRTGKCLEPNWLSVSCRRCGLFRISVPAAQLVGLHWDAVREVSHEADGAWHDLEPLDLDLELLKGLLHE